MRPMNEAPRDDSVITLHMANGHSFRAYLVPVEGEDGPCWAWGEADEGSSPSDWCDGICWEFNSNGRKSSQPIGWSA